MTFKSAYKLPLSFILFFVLTFFLIGEQLPALPTYLIGPGLGENRSDTKVHILDLARGDALHRPIAYVIIGTIIWALFRAFPWPIAWIIGASLWVLEQLTLTPLDQRPSLSHTIFFTLTFWVVLTLVPYFIYRWVDRTWGGKGKRNAILITLTINLLVLSFFAYQIYILGHSYRGLQQNRRQQDSSSSMRVLPPNTCPQRLITKKGTQTVIYWDGKILAVSDEEQKWVEQNCPGVLEQP